MTYEECKGCPYHYAELDLCMVGEDDMPDDLPKKCRTEETV